MKCLKGLNTKQIECVEAFEKNNMVFAGPGTGKTRVVTSKIAYILEKDMLPPCRKVLAITFTNKAADEMKDRIRTLGIDMTRVRMGTFHNFCSYVLRSFGKHISINHNFKFISRNHQLSLARSVCRESNFTVMKPGDFIGRISQLKNASTDYEDFLTKLDTNVQAFESIVQEYQTRMISSGLIDFDDAILLTNSLFQQNQGILYLFHNAYPYLLVDEMQDTNIMQLELVKLLGERVKNVTAVADDDQSIYKWRGALPTIISDFVNHFQADKIILNENYRSPQIVLDAAEELMVGITGRTGKNLEGRESTEDDCVEIHEFPNWMLEVAWVAEKISELISQNVIDYKEIMILYRNRHPSLNSMDEALKAKNIPFQHFGKDFNNVGYLLADQVIDTLKLITDPFNEIVYSTLIDALGKRFGYEEFYSNITVRFGSDIDLLFKLMDKEAADRLDGFIKDLAIFITTADVNEPLNVLYKKIYSGLNVDGALSSMSEEVSFEEKRHLELLYDKLTKNAHSSLSELLANLDLQQGDTDKQNVGLNNVDISTLHAVKGLEYKAVFIIGLEEFTIPGRNRGTELEDEERRLLYVGMTRSEGKLYMSYSNIRIDWYGTPRRQTMSHFLQNIVSCQRIHH